VFFTDSTKKLKTLIFLAYISYLFPDDVRIDQIGGAIIVYHQTGVYILPPQVCYAF